VVKAWEQGWLKELDRHQFSKEGKRIGPLAAFTMSWQKNTSSVCLGRGHADNPYNNRCDELATAAADGKEHGCGYDFSKKSRAGKALLPLLPAPPGYPQSARQIITAFSPPVIRALPGQKAKKDFSCLYG